MAAVWSERLERSGMPMGGFGGTLWVDGVPHGVTVRRPRGYSRLDGVGTKEHSWREKASSEATKVESAGVVGEG